jgi:hypothetical protein
MATFFRHLLKGLNGTNQVHDSDLDPSLANSSYVALSVAEKKKRYITLTPG